MPVSHFEFLVEEQSMENFLKAMLPKMLPEDISFRIHPHQGKAALLRNIENRLRGYAKWLPDDYRIVVIVDRDGDNCEELKCKLEKACNSAGLRSRRSAEGSDWQAVTRIVVEELEAWYFGDWSAVQAAYPKVSSNTPRKARYRDPDAIAGGTWEAFERILQRNGYFKQGLPKAEVATKIGSHIDPERNRSHSFKVFRGAVRVAS